MKGKWWLLGSGIFLTFLTAANQKSVIGYFIFLVACLYWYLTGVMFERYPRSPKADFTGFTTVKDMPKGDGRVKLPDSLGGRAFRRFEIKLTDMVEMDYPIPEVSEKLVEAGFDMKSEITWWDDWEIGHRIFTQEIT